MILDSSALVAIVLREPGFEVLLEKLRAASPLGIGGPTLTEAGMVLSNKLRLEPQPLLDRFLREFGIVVVPFGDQHWHQALEAFQRFGKGRHPAALNFGDCLSYAVARLANLPLLFVGNDFSQTDITVV